MKKYDTIAVSLLCLYIAAFVPLCVKKYLAFGYYDFDTATANQIAWNNLRGDLCYSSLHGGNILGFHAYLFLLLLSPLYALWQSPLMLLCLQTLFLALAGWPIYLVAKREIGGGAVPLLFLLLYLLYPPLGYITLLHVHTVNFAPFLLAWAYLFYRRMRYGPFLAFLVVAMSTREEIAFVAAAFGACALWERRGLRWSVAPLCLGIGWFCAYFFWLAPHLRGGAPSPFLPFYAEAGGSAGAVAANIVRRPLLILGIVLRPAKLLYLFRLFAPLAFLPLLAPGALFLCLPPLLLNLLATKPYVADIIYQYNAPIIPFVFIAGIAGFRRLQGLLGAAAFRRPAAAILAVAGIGFSWRLGPQLHLLSDSWRGAVDCLPRTDPMAAAKWELVRAVPDGLPAATNFGFFTALSSRKELDSIPWVLAGRFGDLPSPYPGRADIQCALIDFGDPTTFVKFYDPRRSPARFREYLARNELGLVRIVGQIALYRRGSPDAVALWERLAPGGGGEGILAAFDGLLLRKAELAPEEARGMRQIRVSSLWEAAGAGRGDLSLILRMRGPEGGELLRQVACICHHLHPTSEWEEGERIQARHFVAVPPDLPRGVYSLQMLPIDTFPPCRVRQFAARPGIVTRDGWLSLGDVRL
ncbi:MAG: DUF2079 domain-containing protein [Candidatus Aureabacteria bacterium]|nr:DUF2079 domain-containing protein [Candidatus Auribacterota bacterium]NLW93791.1 DUF2079 domain-containing protein [Chlamydiota bacterium]HOE26796.1 DUF2079 domain-containing protein [bacterium]